MFGQLFICENPLKWNLVPVMARILLLTQFLSIPFVLLNVDSPAPCHVTLANFNKQIKLYLLKVAPQNQRPVVNKMANDKRSKGRLNEAGIVMRRTFQNYKITLSDMFFACCSSNIATNYLVSWQLFVSHLELVTRSKNS